MWMVCLVSYYFSLQYSTLINLAYSSAFLGSDHQRQHDNEQTNSKRVEDDDGKQTAKLASLTFI
jgi:hypothetical protein